MTTYHINVENDVLKVGFGEPANNDQIVQDAAARLDELIETGQLPGGALLKINGPASVPVSYVIAHKVTHLYGAIAVFDPKIGEKGTNKYIIAIAHNPTYKIADMLDSPEELQGSQSQHPKVKVVLCGPPQSGKSCLREGLKQTICRLKGAPYPYVITACPDGEGAWFSEAARRDPDLARKLKDEYKANFTPEFARIRAGWVRDAKNSLNIIDVGGKISEENRQIMSQATHAVILAGDMNKVAEWKEFCISLNLRVIAIIHSDYEGVADYIQTESPLLTGSIHYLERGEGISTRQMVQALASLLVNLVNSGE